MKNQLLRNLKCSFGIGILFLFSMPAYAQSSSNDATNKPDLANYTVHRGTDEVWTPTNNPVYKANGSKEPVLTISVSNIIIPPGASLTISGMTIKMATDSHVDVYNSLTSNQKGKLTVLNSTITRQNNSGSWGGIRVWGNTSSLDSTALSQQGLVTILNSTISYAETAVSELPYSMDSKHVPSIQKKYSHNAATY